MVFWVGNWMANFHSLAKATINNTYFCAKMTELLPKKQLTKAYLEA